MLNYNGRQWLEDCLTAASRQMDDRQELILVDNASTDDSVEFVRRQFPAVRLLVLDRNFGFARGNNVGARIARGRYLAFLNNDTIPQPGWLSALRAPFDRDRASRRHDIPNRVSPRSVGRSTAPVTATFAPAAHSSVSTGRHRASAGQSGEVFGACGAACMFRKDVFTDLGGFDEDFFMIYEDVDISYRARLRGYRCTYVAGRDRASRGKRRVTPQQRDVRLSSGSATSNGRT